MEVDGTLIAAGEVKANVRFLFEGKTEVEADVDDAIPELSRKELDIATL